jgi:D-tagatose-1,6-bisphosphate aldolase subunit GatZ/KbaZ
VKALLDLVDRHRRGERVGIYSVCSAHPLVLRATLHQARDRGSLALIETTANQVNQYGGYTGLRPAEFRDRVLGMADEIGLPRERVLLGGDHLGPTVWQDRPAATALASAGAMVAEYVSAGYRKIHLDCSMGCADDAGGLSDTVVAERSAALCAHSESAWRASGGEPPVYIIGAEVPSPGGAQGPLHELSVTRPQAALATIEAHRTTFSRHGLAAAWERTIALVVQPGVEFDHDRVIDYVPAKARELSTCLDAQPRFVFEAHSTDYQTAAALAALVRDHFAILKVGPALTFALREALWALDRIAHEWRGEDGGAGVRQAVLAAMRADPTHWRKYYHGEGRDLDLKLAYSLSDRIRYYWPVPAVTAALAHLEAVFAAADVPRSLLHQYLPASAAAVRRGALEPRLPDLVTHHIQQVLATYASACDPGTARVSP